MDKGILSNIKRILRESALTQGTYHNTASLYNFIQMVSGKLLRGRYYSSGYFDRLFSRGPDPWSYQSDPVSEARKELLLALLPTNRVPRLLEIGCATGWMTIDLASHADIVVAVDISETAISLAKRRCEALSNISFQLTDLLTDTIDGTFDVIVCAGVLVFLPWSVQVRVCRNLVNALNPGGTLLLEHLMRGDFGGSSGEKIHDLYANSCPALTLQSRIRQDIYEVIAMKKASDF